MPEFKGTPGPWFITGNMTRYVEARIEGGLIQEVAACGPTAADSGYGQQQEANAQLIAAAPELLEAMQALVARIDYYASLPDRNVVNIEDWAYTAGSDDINAARAALAKALGQ